jgi:DNA-binding FadR family transcriptional regulator
MTEPRVRYTGSIFRETKRSHAADDIFRQLAAAILRGDMKVGSRVPAERVLAARFGTSRITVRQALHRLAEVGLVSTRQGGATTVLDPERAHDLRVIELDYRLGPRSRRDVVEFTEHQLLNAHPLLLLAEERATRDQLAALAAAVESYVSRGATAEDLPAFEERFWTLVAEATDNHLYRREVAWWFRLVRETPSVTHPILAPPETRAAAFRGIVDRLVHRRGAAQYYLSMAMHLVSAARAQLAREEARATRSADDVDYVKAAAEQRKSARARRNGARSQPPRRRRTRSPEGGGSPS